MKNKAVGQGCLWGCGLVTLVLVAIAGTGTWYAAQMAKDFKAVRTTEEELIRQLPADADYVGDRVSPPAADRLRAFQNVRAGLHERRLHLEQQVADFQTAVGHGGGPVGFYRRLRAGTELAPVYAGYWNKRNELLLAAGMGPREYDFMYRLVYYTGFGHDPSDGVDTPAGRRLAGGKPDQDGKREYPEAPAWAGDPAILAAALAPYREVLEAAYSQRLNPLETMFTGE